MSSSSSTTTTNQNLRIRDLGYSPGIHSPGPSNSILDVPGVHVSQITVPTSNNLPSWSSAVKGATIITPRPPKEFYKPCAAGIFTFNGNGEMTGANQIRDWGFVNMPIAFTNSLSCGSLFNGIWDWVLDQQDAMKWSPLDKARHYGTPVVGETSDWLVNSVIRESRLSEADIRKCFEGLKSREDGEPCRRHHHAGGTGTSSRLVGGGEGSARAYTLGVLVQTNYGHLIDLTVGGIPVGKILLKERQTASATTTDQGTDVHAPEPAKRWEDMGGRTQDGSIVILVVTDAPLATHQLQRLARHVTVGLGQVGSYGIGRTHSGDIFVAISTAEQGPEQLEGTKMKHMNPTQTYTNEVVKNESIDPFFYACAEAVEEAILNSLVGGREGVVGMDEKTRVEGFPVEKVREILERYLVQV
ncbi:hypothetical protein M409DRAFT_29126 [Zasmidium cellare ATCC 36951]|uniref:Peptidase S58 DmpA n=1 Tax=Zasmidium cellare ATCC 36951 TaxID=1080233 RepID=A0A6A6C0L1_ZASCE|nr:uncharacterized protein M409DRAFT_29126 [Zasmidium cellare ATCC 36951]KAF2160505.1 hypothetical protein M409DRAFT_29126 [Zasmidium cellare ATCC 36951]